MRARPPAMEGKGRPNKVSGFEARRLAGLFLTTLRLEVGFLAVVFLEVVLRRAGARLAAVLLAVFLVVVPLRLEA